MTWRAVAAFAAGLFLILALSCCTAQPSQYRSPYLGGPNYRVMNVNHMTSAEIRPILYNLYVEVRECTGYDRSFDDIQFYSAGLILLRTNSNMWKPHAGISWGNWIFVINGLPPELWAGTMKHEIAHYLTRMGHPEVNEIMAACGIPLIVDPLAGRAN